MERKELARRVGRVIAARRRALDLTQERMAEKIETSAEWCSQIERGIGSVTLPVLVRVAAALETTPSALLDAALSTDAEPDRAELLALIQGMPPRDLRLLVALARALRVPTDP